WDVAREDWRTFRVDRIDGEVKRREPFSARPLPDGDLATYVRRSLDDRGSAHTARVLIHAPLERLRARIPAGAGRLERVSANRTRFVSGAHSLELLALHVALLGEDFVIEDPPELAETARALSARLARAARAKRGRAARST